MCDLTKYRIGVYLTKVNFFQGNWVVKKRYSLSNWPTKITIDELKENTEYKFRATVFEKIESITRRSANYQNSPSIGPQVGMWTTTCTPPSKDRINLYCLNF